jgi:hypothetical protein
MLETLQPKKADGLSKADSELPNTNIGSILANPMNITPKDPRPKDPAKEAMGEIDKINQSWMGGR